MLRPALWALLGVLAVSTSASGADTPSTAFDSKSGITKVQSRRMPLRVVSDPSGAFSARGGRVDLAFAGWWLGRKCCDPNAKMTYSLTVIAVSDSASLGRRPDVRLTIDGKPRRLLDLRFTKDVDGGKDIEVIAAGIRTADAEAIAKSKNTRITIGELVLEVEPRELSKLRGFLKAFG
ncbi:MAG: hypothetical protein HYV07_15065 [Deltaproteobacteria bacterium]|nr:hypothetical protein [Deltaproteobacteria bacterium]